MSVLVTGAASFVGTLVSLAVKKCGDVVVGERVGLLQKSLSRSRMAVHGTVQTAVVRRCRNG
ncbi:hypothetical protein PanWU01x14_099530 [Parasponia andersonii]|uniref:NAD(P)-binding domain containing protein n=1 Tax=Parasponia andersonii TaxID=3476 RepID=A0A2P5D3T4_PARAD|nr:hypothetical protein PanWU01x14_099530 [Parasponia andersonii]